MYSNDKIPKPCCLFIYWQLTRKALSREEQPAPAEVGAGAGEAWSAHPLSATDLLCGPDKLQMAPRSADLPCPTVTGHSSCSVYIIVMILS